MLNKRASKAALLFSPPSVLSLEIMLIIRGIIQVLGIVPAKGADASISGIAGISHIVLAVALGFFVRSFKRRITGMGKTTDG